MMCRSNHLLKFRPIVDQSMIESVLRRCSLQGKGVEMAAIASIAGDVGNVEFLMLGCCR